MWRQIRIYFLTNPIYTKYTGAKMKVQNDNIKANDFLRFSFVATQGIKIDDAGLLLSAPKNLFISWDQHKVFLKY